LNVTASAARNAASSPYDTIRIPSEVFGFEVTRIDPAG
jgi:hypothetical protein